MRAAVLLLLGLAVLFNASFLTAEDTSSDTIRNQAGHPVTGPGSSAYAAGFADILDNLSASHAIWGVFLKSLDDGRVLYKRNEEKLFIPASNMKLLTTAAALVKLGPDFTYTTNLYGSRVTRRGVLKGDIFLRGSGDPTMAESFHGRAAAVFEEWADELKRKGIRLITGDVVADDNLFDDRELGKGWSWDDELNCYSARVSAVSFNDNCVEITVSPGKGQGEPAVIGTNPETGYVKITNTVRTSAAGGELQVHAGRSFGSSLIKLWGEIPLASAPLRARFSVGNPSLYAATALKEALEGKGIRVKGKAVDIDDTDKRPSYADLPVIAWYRSPPLSLIIEQVNKRSQNLYAELLLRTLGSVYHGEGSAEKGVQVVKETLSVMGIPVDSLAIYDGSGLSRMNLVSPAQIVALLQYMAGHPYFPYFYESLPIAGVDGTLAKRMQNAEAESKVRAKTGTLRHMVSLSGYLKDKNGDWIVFSIMSNNCLRTASEVRLLQDAICERLFDQGLRETR